MSEKAYIVKTIRTNTFKESFIHDVGSVWQAASPLFEANSIHYGIYHNYDSDFKGDYNLSIAVSSPQTENEIILDGKYEIFPVDMTQDNAIAATWARIWETPLERTYGADFEKYLPNGTVAVYISVK